MGAQPSSRHVNSVTVTAVSSGRLRAVPNASLMFRNIKEALGTALNLPEETAVTVTELTCLEEGCAPIETVVALLQPDAPPKQHKIHKSADTVDADDLMQICNS